LYNSFVCDVTLKQFCGLCALINNAGHRAVFLRQLSLRLLVSLAV